MILQILILFVCGALYEALCVGFVHYSERGKPLKTALCSIGAATAEITGLIGSVHDWHVAPFFVLGYGTGTYVAVAWKSRKPESDR